MLELKGKYNIAKVFTDNVDNETISQVIELLNQDYIKDAKKTPEFLNVIKISALCQ